MAPLKSIMLATIVANPCVTHPEYQEYPLELCPVRVVVPLPEADVDSQFDLTVQGTGTVHSVRWLPDGADQALEVDPIEGPVAVDGCHSVPITYRLSEFYDPTAEPSPSQLRVEIAEDEWVWISLVVGEADAEPSTCRVCEPQARPNR